jgi:hypothetical protein
MKDLDGFVPFFTNYDFGIRKIDQKGNIIDWGASVSGSVQKGYRIFVMDGGKHSSLLSDPVLFHSLHIALQDIEQFYSLAISTLEQFPKLVKGL